GTRKALEGQLRAPAGSGQRRDAARDGLLERLEPGFAAGEQVEHRIGYELSGEEGLVHAVAGEWIDEPGGVADHRSRAAREAGRRAAHRQAVAARPGRRVDVDAVLVAEAAQVHPQTRSLALVAANSDVDVVTLREDPAVASVHGRDLEHHRP